jgi:hypothetical protein
MVDNTTNSIVCEQIIPTVAYLSCGEGKFPIHRLTQIIKEYDIKSSTNSNTTTNINNNTSNVILENIHIDECYSIDDLEESLVLYIHIIYSIYLYNYMLYHICIE